MIIKKTQKEYFNIRGQKLTSAGAAKACGIVVERTVEITGRVSVNKKMLSSQ
jgi:hypothetical protein